MLLRKKRDKKIGVVIHPVDRSLLYDYEPGMERFSIGVAQKLLEWMTPFKASDIEGICSTRTRETLQGELIMCPLLIEQMRNLHPRKVFSRVLRAATFAKTRGAGLVALVGYTAMVGKGGVTVQNHLGIPLTTGMHMTIAMVPRAILFALKQLGRRPEKLKLFIYGVNVFAYVLLMKLGRYISEFHVCHMSKSKADFFYHKLPRFLRKKVKVVHLDPRESLRGMDIVVNATATCPYTFDEYVLKPGTIVFDLSYPRDIHIKREDVLLIDGLAYQPPGKAKFNFNFGLPEGLCFPCMVEPMVLFFEGKLVSYSINRDFSFYKMDRIYTLAMKHGFKEKALTSFERVVDKAFLERKKHNRKWI